MLSTKLINGIRRFRRAQGLSIRGYARLAGVSDKPVRGIDDSGWNPTFNTLLKLESVIPPKFLRNANDDANDDVSGDGAAPSAASAGRPLSRTG